MSRAISIKISISGGLTTDIRPPAATDLRSSSTCRSPSGSSLLTPFENTEGVSDEWHVDLHNLRGESAIGKTGLACADSAGPELHRPHGGRRYAPFDPRAVARPGP